MGITSYNNIVAYSVVNYVIMVLVFLYRIIVIPSSRNYKKKTATIYVVFFSGVFFIVSLILYSICIAEKNKKNPDNMDEYEYAASQYMIALIVNAAVLFFGLLFVLSYYLKYRKNKKANAKIKPTYYY